MANRPTFSALSTISFNELNGYSKNTAKKFPIVCKNKTVSIVELKENFEFNINVYKTQIDPIGYLISERTGKRYAVYNSTSNIPCTFLFQVPPMISVGLYRLELTVRSTEICLSDIFEVVNFDNEICQIKSNNTEGKFFDGTPSVIGNREFYFYHYFLKKDFEIKVAENNEFYNNERGLSFSLQNRNYQYSTLSGYACEYTTNALAVLSASSFFCLTFISKYSKSNLPISEIYILTKVGTFATEKIGNDFKSFTCDFNFIKSIFEKKILQIDDPIISIIFSQQQEKKTRVPIKVLCLPYSNVDFQFNNKDFLTFDTNQILELWLNNVNKIPDNFGSAVKENPEGWIDFKIHNANSVVEFGSNVKIVKKSANGVFADFKSLRKIGKNVTIKDISGEIQMSDNSVFDNFTTTGTNIFAKNAIIKNSVVNDNFISGSISLFENCTIRNIVLPDNCVLKNCKIDRKLLNFSEQNIEFINCEVSVNNKSTNIEMNLTNFKGSFKNSFKKDEITIINSATPTYDVDENSFAHYKTTENVPYILGRVLQEGRFSLVSPENSTKFLELNKNFINDVVGDTMFTTENETSSNNPDINSINFPENYILQEGFLNDLSNTIQFEIPESVEIMSNNLNFIRDEIFTIQATHLLDLLQHKENCLNDIDYLRVINNLPLDFDYSNFLTNDTILQNLIGYINVYQDDNGFLLNRLMQLYPTYSIMDEK